MDSSGSKSKVPGGNMATLRKTEFFQLEIAGKSGLVMVVA
jgi:hypothetical protein